MIQRPVVRYHGGKWRIASWVISHFPEHRIYVEPFGGGGSVLMKKEPSSIEVYNDLNGEMVNCFRVIRSHPDRLAELLRATPCSAREFEEAYEHTEDSIERARRTIVKGFQAHGSTGCSGGKMTGWRRRIPKNGGRISHDWHAVWEHVADWADRVRGVYIENEDALTVMKRWDAIDALHYVDPPYPASTRSSGSGAEGYAHEMTDAEHQTLAIVLGSLRGTVILSGYRCPLYDELFAGWKRVEKKALADHGQARTECLWIRGAK